MTATPTNSGDIQVLRTFLRDIGYRDDLIHSKFPVWLGQAVEIVDFAAFGRIQPADMTTATIIAHSLPSKAAMGPTIEAAQAIACPAAVLTFPESVEVWSVSAPPGSATQIESVPRNEAEQLARRIRSELEPDVLLRAKTTGRQAALFPVDIGLLSKAQRNSSEHLSSRVGDAMAHILSPLPDSEPRRAKLLVDASRVVVGALAALMVRDKFKLVAHGSELFQLARSRFGGYFDWLDTLDSFTEQQLSEVLEILGDGVDYEGLAPAVVSEVYEMAVVSQSDRLQLGIFYTPPDLARRIAEHLPFEELPSEDRIVFDPACGSGTLLLAAYDRLQRLAPANWDPFRQHDYLVSHLAGYDTDQFAVEIAKLSLLLHALPVGNSWNIERRDTRFAPIPSPRPSVVLSNPPWRDERSRAGVRRQLADDFLERMLDFVKPGGFIAVLLPSGWLSTVESQTTRRLVRERTDVFEVWRLPESTFGSGHLGPCVLLAQAKPSSGRSWVFRRVLTDRTLSKFYETGSADEQFLAQPTDYAPDGALLRGPLHEAGELLANFPQLHSRALVQNGPVPEPPTRERGGVGPFWWLRFAKDLPAYGESAAASLLRVRFPDDFHRAGTHDGRIYRRSKILVSAKRSPDNPWRLKVGVDFRGIIPRESLYMILPHADDENELYALVALLGSSVASCWIDTYNSKMAIDAHLLGSLPIPPPDASWNELADVGRRLVASSGQPAELSILTREADRLAARAYRLPAEVIRGLNRHFAGFTAPGEKRPRYEAVRSSPLPKGVDSRSFGGVLAVEGRKLRLWVSGETEDDGRLLPLPDRFLGWHCEAGRTFEISDEDEGLGSARYHFQARSYQDMEQLTDELSAI
jgi:hypothetical protein